MKTFVLLLIIVAAFISGCKDDVTAPSELTIEEKINNARPYQRVVVIYNSGEQERRKEYIRNGDFFELSDAYAEKGYLVVNGRENFNLSIAREIDISKDTQNRSVLVIYY